MPGSVRHFYDWISECLIPETGLSEHSAVSISRLLRADLVALNESSGPSYIFEFKYRRDACNSNPDTVRNAKIELYETARAQVLKYAELDDKLRTVSELHKYVIMCCFGELDIIEVFK